MKVRVVLTVELDVEDWTTAYGVSGASEIRQDVREYILNMVQQGETFCSTGEVPATVTLGQ